MSCRVQLTIQIVTSRYLIQRKQSGNDGSSFIYEAGPNAVDELLTKGGIDSYLDQVCALIEGNIRALTGMMHHQHYGQQGFVM